MGLTVNRQMAKKINRQPSKTEYFYRQPSNERAKISLQISQISSNDRDRLPKSNHQLVEQAINTSSGNGGEVKTLIIHIVVIVEDHYPHFSAQIVGLIPVFKFEQLKLFRFIKTHSQTCALNSCDKRYSEKLTVNRQMI